MANNTGVCQGATSFPYAAKLIESTLMLSGLNGCVGGEGFALAVTRVSPTKFRATTANTVMVCTSTVQPPGAPIDLTATASSTGVALSWTSNGGTPSSYEVLKKTNGVDTQIATPSEQLLRHQWFSRRPLSNQSCEFRRHQPCVYSSESQLI